MQPNEVFRFVAQRAPRQRRPRLDLGLTANVTPFARRVLDDLRAGDARSRVAVTIADFLASDAFATRPRERRNLALLDDFHGLLRREPPADSSQAVDLVTRHFGAAPAAFLRARQTVQARDLARDGIIALKLAANPPPGALATYTRIFQSLRFVERLVASPEEIDFSRPSSFLTLPVRFPAELATLLPLRTSAPNAAPTVPAPAGAATAARLVRLDQAILELAAQPKPFARRGLTAPTSGATALVLATEARTRLSATTRGTLDAEAIDIAEVELLDALDALEAARVVTLNELTARDTAGDASARVVLGSLVMPSAGNAPMIPLDPTFLDPSTRPPTTVGPLEPSSVGQLLITRQQIKRYEAGEISHVESVLQSESRSRNTRRLSRTEETFLTEQENTEEEERDLQTTERLELQSEIEKTIADSRAFEVGGSISAGYGPFIQVEANTNYQTESSTEQGDSKVSNFAQEMTERAAKNVTQRILTRQTRTTLEEFEETNSHGFDNTNGTGNVTGIYQWLDRIYELQVYDVGVRIIFEFTLPEPAALYLRALESQVVKSEGLSRPPPLTIRPADINANNVDLLAARYQAEGITPPPPYRINVGHAFAHASPEGRATGFAASEVVKIKPGYRAVLARAEIRIDEPLAAVLPPGFGPEGDDEPLSRPDNNRVDVLVADVRLTRAQVAGENDVVDQEDALDDLDGELPIAVTAINVVSFAATVTIDCLRRPQTYREWQIKTYEALATAYRARLTEYKNERATLATQQAGLPSGSNPTHNRIVEQNEIKRLAITMLSGQRFHSTSVPLSPQAAEFDFDRALAAGNYARFWETVIEWRNLAYVFHPYYWADQSTWGRMLVEDADPLHANFISAGAVTIRLAVTPGLEAAMLHFLETGNIWTGGDLPEVTRDEYIAFLDEIDARRPAPASLDQPLGGMPSEEIPVGPPWDIRLPTTLVALRSDSTLPRWVRDENGAWIPDEVAPADP